MKPWERYQQPDAKPKPWERYAEQPTSAPPDDQALGLPEFNTIAGNQALFGGQFGDENTGLGQILRDATAGLFTLDPKARVQGIEKRFPELNIERLGEDNAVITNPKTGGQAVVNAGGLSNSDIAPFIGGAIASLPAAGIAAKAGKAWQGIAAGTAAEAVTDVALQQAEKIQGGEQDYNPYRTLGAAAVGGVGSGGVKGVQAWNKRNQKLTDLLKNNPDARVAKYTLNGAGKVKTDPLAKETIKQGFDEGVIATVKGSSKTDKKKMLQMVNIMEKGKNNPKVSATNRPSDVVGSSVIERFNVVLDANKKAGSKLDGVAKSLKGQQVDVKDAIDSFLGDVDDMGITFDPKELKANYMNSDIEGLAGPQNVFNRIISRMKNTKTPDAYDVHRLKRFIDEQVTYGKSAEGLGGKSVNVLKSLRHNLDSKLDESFESYNQVNTTYSQTRDAIDDFQTAAGKKINLKGANVNKAVGTLSRRVLSNAQSRVEVVDMMQKLQDVALKNGGKFEDDIISQIVFVDDLERSFGSSAKTSFAGDIEKSVNRAGTAAGRLRSSQGLFDLSVNAAGAGVEKMRGINQDNAFKAIRELLAN